MVPARLTGEGRSPTVECLNIEIVEGGVAEKRGDQAARVDCSRKAPGANGWAGNADALIRLAQLKIAGKLGIADVEGVQLLRR
jgi:hypothetical protein